MIISMQEICWSYLRRLADLQEKEGLLAANKLSRRHMMWHKQKMKVNLAAQTLSASVADALDFCREDLHLPDFKGSKSTSNFIRIVDRYIVNNDLWADMKIF